MAIVLTVAGVTKFPLNGSLRISRTANGRSTAAFAIKSLDATYRPALDAEVIVTENAVRIFGGLLDRPRERGLVDGSSVGILTTMDAVDFNAYADRVHVNEVFPSQSLEATLVLIVANYLVGYGVTLDAGQVTGPTLPELSYLWAGNHRVSDVLNELATLTADVGEPYVWRIDDFKVLSMFQASTVPAPFDLVGEVIPEVMGDVEVETIRGPNYANEIIIQVPPTTEMNREETFVATAAQTTFPLQYTLFAHRGYITANGIFETFTTVPGDVATWTYDVGTNSIIRNAGLAASDVVVINFDGTFTAVALAVDAGEVTAVGLWQRIYTLQSIPSDTTAQALADAYLARALPVTKNIRYRTRELGVAPGQSQTVTIARRNLSATAVITDVTISDRVEQKVNILVRDVTAVIDAGQTNLGRGFRDDYKIWYGDKTGASTAMVAGTTVGGGDPPGGGTFLGDTYVLKTADETLSGSAALQDDNHLSFAVGASSVYVFELTFMHDGDNTTHDLKIGWTVPSGTTMLWGPQAQGGANYWITLNAAGIQTALLTESSVLDIGSTNAAGIRGGWFLGYIFTSTTAGTVQLQWAQNVSDAGTLTLKKHSYLKYRRLGNV